MSSFKIDKSRPVRFVLVTRRVHANHFELEVRRVQHDWDVIQSHQFVFFQKPNGRTMHFEGQIIARFKTLAAANKRRQELQAVRQVIES